MEGDSSRRVGRRRNRQKFFSNAYFSLQLKKDLGR